MVVSIASCVQPYARRSAHRHQRKDVNSNTGGKTLILCWINNRYALPLQLGMENQAAISRLLFQLSQLGYHRY
ncbi:hypothetical protein F441_09092 [Phytophthora nicotianae CJ01A1]|uniref:Uncharacterized protein n=2 Tax=Phytophthora nicotianae TaxID=4792 RepID=W2X178_PHYNI|nr:hypothetical protein F444_09182 [Phytophthora nicotianae P1976]ETP16287.1 hypothetical protein F441_09092 [Phytophthora nicotianae CJ01A1]